MPEQKYPLDFCPICVNYGRFCLKFSGNPTATSSTGDHDLLMILYTVTDLFRRFHHDGYKRFRAVLWVNHVTNVNKQSKRRHRNRRQKQTRRQFQDVIYIGWLLHVYSLVAYKHRGLRYEPLLSYAMAFRECQYIDRRTTNKFLRCDSDTSEGLASIPQKQKKKQLLCSDNTMTTFTSTSSKLVKSREPFDDCWVMFDLEWPPGDDIIVSPTLTRQPIIIIIIITVIVEI